MLVELKNGANLDVSATSVKRLSYQNIRGNKRFYVAIGNDYQASEIEITKGSYMKLTEEIIYGTARSQAEDSVLLPTKKRGNRKTKGTE